jgi:4a-hydroxytetrahydrobiopterin dehydratase
MSKQADRVYSETEVNAYLQQHLPHWKAAGGAIARTYRTHSWKGTLMVVNTVGHLAEAAWHHPDLAVSYASVEVRLSTHSAGGITDKEFALAAKIEEVVLWRPGQDGGPLEGTPDDERHAYIKHEA